MKVKRTLIFPFEPPVPRTPSKLSFLQMAAQWLETTMQALKDSKEEAERAALAAEPIHESATDNNLPIYIQERSLRNCHYQQRLSPRRVFQASLSRSRLPSKRAFHRRSGPHH